MDLEIAGQLAGVIRCNTFQGGSAGLQVRGPQGFALDTNAFELQVGHAMTSTAPLEASNNWWGSAAGPAYIVGWTWCSTQAMHWSSSSRSMIGKSMLWIVPALALHYLYS